MAVRPYGSDKSTKIILFLYRLPQSYIICCKVMKGKCTDANFTGRQAIKEKIDIHRSLEQYVLSDISCQLMVESYENLGLYISLIFFYFSVLKNLPAISIIMGVSSSRSGLLYQEGKQNLDMQWTVTSAAPVSTVQLLRQDKLSSQL